MAFHSRAFLIPVSSVFSQANCILGPEDTLLSASVAAIRLVLLLPSGVSTIPTKRQSFQQSLLTQHSQVLGHPGQTHASGEGLNWLGGINQSLPDIVLRAGQQQESVAKDHGSIE